MENQIEFTAIKKDLIMIGVVIAFFVVILGSIVFLESKNGFVSKSSVKISSFLLK